MAQEEMKERIKGSPTMVDLLQSSRSLSEETLKEIKNCLDNPDVKSSYLSGILFGTTIGFITPIVIKPLRKFFIICPVIGGIYGSLVARYSATKDCLSQVLGPEMNNLSRFDKKPIEAKRGSQMDIDTFQQIDQHDEFPSINAREYQPNANLDVLEQKISNGTTYDELRQKNRDSYRMGQIRLLKQRAQRPVDSSENQSSQSQDFNTDSNTESDLFPSPSDTGKRKTKYGDIWD
ncbi:hypothetical protein M0802_005332 [Mischocyttarus mexicanus]|nr:hypothetical protein M0802_005332 [Mischocyttarus mexicanus]